jgi:hypothetical protein
MDRISAIRNVEDALRAFEEGEADLAEMEREVVAVLRTYATEFEGGERPDLAAYRARGDDAVDGTVVVAASPADARRRVSDLVDGDHDFSVDRLDP